MLNNKKGSLNDLIVWAVILLILGISILIGFRMAADTNTHIQADPNIPANAKAVSAQMYGYYPGVINNSFLFLTFGLAFATLILAALVRIHPVFIPFYIIGLVIVIIVSGILSNIYGGMAENATLAAQAAQLDKVGLVLDYLPWFVGVFGTILMVVMYKTWRVTNE